MQAPPVLSLVVWTQLLLAVWKCGESLVSFLIWAWHTCNQKMMKICRTSRLRFTFSTDYTLNAWCVRQVVSRSLIPRLLPCRKTGREPGRTDRVPVTVHLTSRWHHSYNRPFPFLQLFHFWVLLWLQNKDMGGLGTRLWRLLALCVGGSKALVGTVYQIHHPWSHNMCRCACISLWSLIQCTSL